MSRYILLALFIGLALGQNINDSNYNYENQILRLKKAENIVAIKPNQKIFINDSLMVYISIDYINKLIKLETPIELELSFDAIHSFRYQKSNIISSLDKAWHYKDVGCTLGCLYGCYVAYETLSRPNDVFAFTKIFVPIYIALLSGFGGILGGITGGFIGLIYPNFSDVKIVDEGEWEIVLPQSMPLPIQVTGSPLLIGSTVSFIGPIAASYLLPADDFRLDNLSTKNEKHRNAYHSTSEREIRKKRLKFSLIGTSCATAGFSVYALLSFITFIGLMGHH